MNDKLFLANLITYRARSFASGLAGSLAFAAAAGVNRCLQGCIVDCNDAFSHAVFLLCQKCCIYYIAFCLLLQIKSFFGDQEKFDRQIRCPRRTEVQLDALMESAELRRIGDGIHAEIAFLVVGHPSASLLPEAARQNDTARVQSALRCEVCVRLASCDRYVYMIDNAVVAVVLGRRAVGRIDAAQEDILAVVADRDESRTLVRIVRLCCQIDNDPCRRTCRADVSCRAAGLLPFGRSLPESR